MFKPVQLLRHANDARSSLVKRAPTATIRQIHLNYCSCSVGKMHTKRAAFDIPDFGKICSQCKKLNHLKSTLCCLKKKNKPKFINYIVTQ